MAKNDGGAAFPVSSGALGDGGYDGMSMRQYYKAAALQGLLAANPKLTPQQVDGLGKAVGDFADAMIAEDEEAAKEESK